jgi:hypothetical protein
MPKVGRHNALARAPSRTFTRAIQKSGFSEARKPEVTRMPARKKHPAMLNDRRPSRQREAPPECHDAPGNAPDHLTDEQRAIWCELLELAPEGVLSRADRPSIEQACRLIAAARAGSLAGSGEALLHKVLVSLGCTPGGRVALSVPIVRKPKEPNPFANL